MKLLANLLFSFAFITHISFTVAAPQDSVSPYEPKLSIPPIPPPPPPGFTGHPAKDTDEVSSDSHFTITSCYGWGEYIEKEKALRRTEQYCRERAGWAVLKFKSVSDEWSIKADMSYREDLWIFHGSGWLQFSYRNTGPDWAWMVTYDECKYMMETIIKGCGENPDGSGDFTRGGRMYTTKGHVMVDPNNEIRITYE